MDYLISCHDDDSALFAAFTCMRERPTVVVVADSYVQPARGEIGCSAEERAAETARAHAILGCPTQRLGLRDDALTLAEMTQALSRLSHVERVYVPALEGGHPQHDLVAHAAACVFPTGQLHCYSTYAKLSQYDAPDLQPVGTEEVTPTEEEAARKMEALRCYESQARINLPHFQAVTGRSEWLSGYRRVHLGCGERPRAGWINIDRCVPSTADDSFRKADCECDDLTALVGSHIADYVFSEDFLEHVSPDKRVHVINQCWDILKPGGIMEHYVPNAGSQNDFGSPSHLSHWNLQTFEHFDVDSYRWAKDRHFEGIRGGFRKVSADLLNWRVEADGVRRAQSLRVRYRAVAC
jgi:LmbE family N-acetylglucosaminyl deacetylase